MGKKTSSTTTAILAIGFVIPNQLLMIGATAMIGMAEMPMATGRMASRALAHRATANATTTPMTTPMPSPPSASKRVFEAAFWSVAHSATRAVPMADGRGRMNCRRLRMLATSSQTMSTPKNSRMAGRL